MNIPPDRIETLKDVLWYLKHYEMTILAHDQENNKIVRLGEADSETWATIVAGYLQNNQLPAREILEDEAKRMIEEIENAKTTSFAVDSGADDRRCCGGKCRDNDHE